MSKENKGVAKSVVSGVTSLCSKYGWVIVLEDDLVVAPDFLRFMELSLKRYQHDTSVMQIGAYTIAPPQMINTNTFFLPVTTTWGWGTWARAWAEFSNFPKGWPETANDREWLSLFQINGAGDYMYMLNECLAGRNDSWGILWWYAVSRLRGQVLYPSKSMVWNIGFDGSGVHCGNSSFRWQNSVQSPIRIFGESITFPDKVQHRPEDFEILAQALRDQKSNPARGSLYFILWLKNLLLRLK